jgi:hypothetical protein
MKKKKNKENNLIDKKYLKLDSIKYKNCVYELGMRYRINKGIAKMKVDQLVELIQIQSETTCKVQSYFDHSTAIVNFSDLYDF